MTKMSTLTGLFLWTVAAQAAPSVTLSGECGAWVTASVTLDAEGDYRMIWGDAGIVSVPMGRCAGTEVGVDGPASPVARTAVAGIDDTAVLVAGERCTQSLQVIDMTTCEVSPVVSLSTLPGVGYINCFQSSYCLHYDLFWMTGLPVSRVGPATEHECMPDGDDGSPNADAWLHGSTIAFHDEPPCDYMGCLLAGTPIVCTE